MATNLKSDFNDFLQRVPVFAEFGPGELSALERAMTVDRYPDGHVFIGETEPGESLFLIIEGRVIATHKRLNIRGMDVVEHLEPGELFGIISLIDNGPSWATYRAAGAVTAASLPIGAFELLFTAHAPIAHHFQNLIAMQLARDLRTCAKTLREAGSEQQPLGFDPMSTASMGNENGSAQGG
jgi:CRP-like cAMP-binding protein